MIDSIQIAAAQSHEGTKLDFVSGLNVIVGQSDSGKSAILRALLWALTNKPAGESLTPHGADFADVRVVVDGHEVRRVKGKSTNEYWIDDQKFVAFGRGVPEPVAELVNVDDVNIQRQMDPPFLLSMSGQEVARFLSRMVDLDVIGRSLKAAVGEERRAATDLAAVRVEVDRLCQRVSEYEYLSAAEDLVCRIEAEFQALDLAESRLEKLERGIRGLVDVQTQIDRLSKFDLDSVQKDVDAIEVDLKELSDTRDRVCRLESLVGDIRGLESSLSSQLPADIEDIDIEEFEQVLRERDRLAALVSDLTDTELWISSCVSGIEELEDELRSIADELGDTCPVCGQEVREWK